MPRFALMEPRETCLDPNTVAGYVDGALDASTARRVDKHIDKCQRCRAELSDLALAADSLPDTPGAEPRPLDAAELVPGSRVGRYEVRHHHATGGMGMVVVAHDPELERDVALKLLRPEVSERERLRREARAMARLAHPNVVRVYDVVDDGGQLVVAMEYVQGHTLRSWIADRDRSWREVLEACIAAGRGLAAAHQVGLVHRDFKPDNVLVADDGRVLVTDFGLASTADAEPQQRRVVAGTPVYMAPELHSGGKATAASDEFSFCVTVWEALFGKLPFQGSSWPVLSERVSRGEITPAPSSSVPARIRTALTRGLAPEPAERFGAMSALLAALAGRRVRPWHWAAAAVGLGVLGAAAFISFGAADPRARPCEVTRAQLAGAWDNDVRARIVAAFETAAGPEGTAAAKRLAARLDRYAEDWVAVRTEACAATHLRGEQSEALLDQRMQCLDRREAELGELTRLFAKEADQTLVRRAVAAVDRLARPSSCSAERVGTRFPLPEDAALSTKIATARADHARATALFFAGRPKEARPVAKEVVVLAKELDYPPLLAEATLTLGTIHTALSEFDEAEEVLFEALGAAERAGDQVRIATSWVSLVSAVGGQKQDFELAMAYAKAAEAKFAGIRANAPLRARLSYVLGSKLSAQGRHREARERFEEALELNREHYGPEHATVGDALGGLCMALYQLSELDEAMSSCARAVSIHEKVYSPDAPDLAYTINILGSIQLAHGELDDATESFRRVAGIAERSVGPQSLLRPMALINLGVIHRRRGDHERAVESYREALAALDRHHPDHPLRRNALLNLGNALTGLGENEQAIQTLKRARDLAVRIHGPDHKGVATASLNLGTIYFDLGDHDRAEPMFHQALAVSKRALGEKNPTALRALLALGVLAKERGESRRALRLIRRGLAMAEEMLGPDHLEVASALAKLGDTYYVAGQHGRAVEPLERAVQIYEKNDTSPGTEAAARFALARAQWSAGGERRQALRQARRARELLEGATATRLVDIRARLDRWLAEHN